MIHRIYAAYTRLARSNRAQVGPQGMICENDIEGDSKAARGDGMDGIDPSADCPSDECARRLSVEVRPGELGAVTREVRGPRVYLLANGRCRIYRRQRRRTLPGAPMPRLVAALV